MAGASDPEHSNAIIIDMQTKQPATIPANIRQAVAAGDKTAWLRPVGITADDKYMIFYSARAYVFLFLDLNAKQFDGSLMTKDPGNVGNYSFRQTSPVGSIVFSAPSGARYSCTTTTKTDHRAIVPRCCQKELGRNYTRWQF